MESGTQLKNLPRTAQVRAALEQARQRLDCVIFIQ